MTKTFYEWLTTEDHEDQQINEIARIASENQASWTNINSISSGIQAVNTLPVIDLGEKNSIISKLSIAFETYVNTYKAVKDTTSPNQAIDPRQINWLQRQFEYILNNPRVILGIVLFIGAIGGVIFVATNITPDGLSDIASARGFIAFIFAIGTVGIGFMMVYIALMDDKTEFNAKFDLGKQIFTALLGVFATIVGFYFGSMDQAPNERDNSGEVQTEDRNPNSDVPPNDQELQTPIPSPPQERSDINNNDQQLFMAALRDAAHAEEHEVTDMLIPLSPRIDATIEQISSPALSTLMATSNNNNSLLVTWMSEESYSRFYKPSYEKPEPDRGYLSLPERNIVLWVTSIPQVKNFCSSLKMSRDRTSRRLKQYLGLNPNKSYDVFVELAVQHEDLIRPCPDPEITDRRCEAQLLAPPLNGDTKLALERADARIEGGYYEWFRRTTEIAYHSNPDVMADPNPVPWTRLGYTYDWGNPIWELGASEFVVLPGSRIKVERVFSTDEYCSTN